MRWERKEVWEKDKGREDEKGKYQENRETQTASRGEEEMK